MPRLMTRGLSLIVAIFVDRDRPRDNRSLTQYVAVAMKVRLLL